MSYSKLQARYWEATVAPAFPAGSGLSAVALTTFVNPTTALGGLRLDGWWVDQSDFVGLYFTAHDQLDHFLVRYGDSGDLTNCALDCDVTWSNVVSPLNAVADLGIRAFGDDGILRTYYISSFNYSRGTAANAASGTVTITGNASKIGDIVYCYVNGWYNQYVTQASDFQIAPASANIAFGGTPKTGDVVFCYINGFYSSYTVAAGDTLQSIANGLAAAINANASLSTLVVASTNAIFFGVLFITALAGGPEGNSITLSVGETLQAGSTLTITASGSALTGGIRIPILNSIAAGLKAVINLNNQINTLVIASAINTNVITITALQQGSAGNTITLSSGQIIQGSGNLTATASGTTLTGGTDPTKYHYHFDFNNLTDTLGRRVPTARVDSILWTFTPLAASVPIGFNVTFDNWLASGNVALGAEPANLANKNLGVSINYDAVWALAPERIITNLQRLGLNGRIDLFIGSEKYYRKKAGGGGYSQGRAWQVDSTVAFDTAANQWFTDFLARAKTAGFSVMAEIGMECVDPQSGWAQQSNGGTISGAQSGQGPWLFALTPSPSSLRTWIQLVCTTMAGLMNTAGLIPRIQFAEWQWWTGLSSLDNYRTVPFFYDSATTAAFIAANPGKTLYVFSDITVNPNVDPYWGLAASSTNFLATQFGGLMNSIRTAVLTSYSNALFEADYYNPSIDPYALMQQATYDTNNTNHSVIATFKTSCYGWTRTGDLSDQLASIKFPQTYVGAQAGNNTALGFTAANSSHVCGYALPSEQQTWLAIQAEITVCQTNSIGVIQVWDYYLIMQGGFLNSTPFKTLLIPQGMSHQVKDLEGQASIGSFEFQLIDPDGTVGSLAQNKTLESRTGRLLLGFPTLNSTEFVPVHQFQVRRIEETEDGVWLIDCDDIQRFGKQKIFLEGSTDTGGTPVLRGNGAPVSKSNPRIIRANPMDILLAVFQNELGYGQSLNYARADWLIYDPTKQSTTLINPNPFVDVPQILNLRNTIFAGEIMEFSLTQATEAKSWLEKEIFKANGIYPVVAAQNPGFGNFSIAQPPSPGMMSLRTIRAPVPLTFTPWFLNPPITSAWAFSERNVVGIPKLERAAPINKVTVRFDYDGSKFATELTLTEPRSIQLLDQEFSYVYESAGLKSIWGGARKAGSLARRLLRRYAFATPIYSFDSFLQAVIVEVGDYVVFSHATMRDPISGSIGIPASTCEVIDKQPDYARGKIAFKLLDTRAMKLGAMYKIPSVTKGLTTFPNASFTDQKTYMFVSSAALGGAYSNGVSGNTIY